MSQSARQKIALSAMALCAAALLYARFELAARAAEAETLRNFIDQAVVARGVVADDPDARATSVHVLLAHLAINNQAVSGTLLALLPVQSVVAYGEELEVRGLVEAPQAFVTDTGRAFDYPGYLRVRGVGAVMQRATITQQAPAGLSFMGALFGAKHRFERVLEQSVPEPQVSLLQGMLLGERGGFSPELLQAFVAVGLIHIVVLSGSNISIVSEGVFRALGFLPKTAQYAVGLMAIVLFALLAGGGAATVRAVLMGAIAVLARYLHRPQDALRALVVAAYAMALWNPLVLLHDNGFMLSVLATFGMITLSPWFEQWLRRVPNWRRFNLRSIVATTLGVELFILPALLYFSGVLSFASVPINALVLPLVPVVMFFGALTGFLGFASPYLALVPALVTDLFLRLILFITESAAALPASSIIIPPFSGWVVVLLYIPLTWWTVRIYTKQNKLRQTLRRATARA